RCLDDATENKRDNIGNIRDGLELPGAGGTILVLMDGAAIVITTTVVVVVMHNTKHKRHAQVHQPNDHGSEAKFHHASSTLNAHREKVKVRTTQVSLDGYGNRPRACLAAAMRLMPRARAASRMYSLFFLAICRTCWYATSSWRYNLSFTSASVQKKLCKSW